MNLLINPISENIRLTLVESGKVVEDITIPKWKDFDMFPETLVEMVDRHDIDTIWCICGPAAFTRIRIVTLAINSLALVRNISLKWCHFFDIIDSTHPILKANDREYIIDVWHGETKLVEVGDIPPGNYTGYGEKNDFTDDKVFIEYSYNLDSIERMFSEKEPVERLNPIYLKDAHITWSKKSTSHS